MTTQTTEQMAAAVAEVLIVNDLLDDIIRDADSHSMEQAVTMHDAISQVIAKAREALEALVTHLVDVMEGDVEYRGNQYAKRPKTDVERFDHDEIRRWIINRVRAVADAAVPEETDDYLRGLRVGADVATRTMADIYLNDSAKAKVGELERYGIPCVTNADGSVRTKKRGAMTIKVIPLQKGAQR